MTDGLKVSTTITLEIWTDPPSPRGNRDPLLMAYCETFKGFLGVIKKPLKHNIAIDVYFHCDLSAHHWSHLLNPHCQLAKVNGGRPGDPGASSIERRSLTMQQPCGSIWRVFTHKNPFHHPLGSVEFNYRKHWCRWIFSAQFFIFHFLVKICKKIATESAVWQVVLVLFLCSTFVHYLSRNHKKWV